MASKKRPPSPSPWLTKASSIKKSKSDSTNHVAPPLPLDWTNMKRCVPSKTEYIPTKFSTNPNPLPRSGSLNLLKLDSTPWFHGVFNSKTFLFTPKYNCCEDCGDGSYTEYYVEYYFTNEKNNKKEKICIGTASVRGGDGMVWDGCIRGDYEEIRTLKSSYSVLTQSFRGWLKKFKITKVEEMDKLGEGVVVNCEVVIDM